MEGEWEGGREGERGKRLMFYLFFLSRNFFSGVCILDMFCSFYLNFCNYYNIFWSLPCHCSKLFFLFYLLFFSLSLFFSLAIVGVRVTWEGIPVYFFVVLVMLRCGMDAVKRVAVYGL